MMINIVHKKINSTRSEHLTKLSSGYSESIPLSWKLGGNLVRKERPNKSRRGSPEGRIGRNKVIDATMGLKNFKAFLRRLQAFIKRHGERNTKRLWKAYQGVRTSIYIKG